MMLELIHSTYHSFEMGLKEILIYLDTDQVIRQME